MALVICPLDSLMDNHSKDLIQKSISSAILRCGGLETDTAERDSCSDTESSSSDDEKLLAIDSETENYAIPANNTKNQSETRIELNQTNHSARQFSLHQGYLSGASHAEGPGDEVDFHIMRK